MNSLIAQAPPLGVYLRLGRVSNLPTVWTNVLAGTFVMGGNAALAHPGLWVVLVAISAFYLAGMYLNDAFDRAIDARERPGRPIPSGQIGAAAVFGIGFALLAIGLAGLALCGPGAMLAGCALAAAILVYDIWHKGNPASPLVMGVCRALVYLAAGMAVVAPQGPVTGGALAVAAGAIVAHVAGLTYAARQESLDRMGRLWPLAVLALPVLVYGALAVRQAGPAANGGMALNAWLPALLAALAAANAGAVRMLARRRASGDVPRAVARLIAAIALLDGVVIAAAGGPPPVLLACVAAYGVTRLLQRVIPGT